MARLLEAGLCALLALAPLAQSGGKDRGSKKKDPPKTATPAQQARLPVFTGKLAEARKLARERNAGLLVHILLKDMETENVEYRKRFLEEPGMLAACERLVVLISDNGAHPSKTIEELVEGKKQTRNACSVHPWFETCAQHQQSFNDLALEYRGEDGDLHCPQTILVGPDGKLVARLNTGGVGEPAEILAGLDELAKKFGPGLSESEWTELVRTLEEARAAQAAKSWPQALRQWTRVRDTRPLSAYGVEAAKALPEVEKAFNAELDALCADFVPGKAAAAWKRLAEWQRVCAGMPAEKDIAARLRKAEAKKELQDELAKVKLEEEADALLRTAQDLADAKKEKELEKLVRKLLGKRYAATPAAERARSLWPDWAADEARKNSK